jgi:hypothetical protein
MTTRTDHRADLLAGALGAEDLLARLPREGGR